MSNPCDVIYCTSLIAMWTYWSRQCSRNDDFSLSVTISHNSPNVTSFYHKTRRLSLWYLRYDQEHITMQIWGTSNFLPQLLPTVHTLHLSWGPARTWLYAYRPYTCPYDPSLEKNIKPSFQWRPNNFTLRGPAYRLPDPFLFQFWMVETSILI